MTKKEFIERLERNLSALKAEDRENALAFYEEYFDEAGEGAESAAADELGSPEKLAEEILCILIQVVKYSRRRYRSKN